MTEIRSFVAKKPETRRSWQPMTEIRSFSAKKVGGTRLRGGLVVGDVIGDVIGDLIGVVPAVVAEHAGRRC